MEDAKRQAMRAHQLHQLKKEAIAYYQANGAPQKMEESLNLMFKEKPDCVFGYLSNFFDELAAAPVVSGLSASRSFDNRGLDTVTACVTCRHKNREKSLGRYTAVVHNNVYEHDKQEAKDKDQEEQEQHVSAAVAFVNEGAIKELGSLGVDPRSQREIDEFLVSALDTEEQRLKEAFEKEAEESAEIEEAKETGAAQPKAKEPTGSAKKRGGKGKEVVIIPDEPREGLIPGALAVGAVSAACALSGAVSGGLPLYQHLRQLYDPDNSTWRLPLPMITILSGGKSSPGKSNCVKEYMLVPQPSLPYGEVLPAAVKVYQQVAKTLGVKSGPAVRLINDVGSLNVVIDRPEAGFDIINDALRTLELLDSFQLAINVAGHELFDYDKGKYDLLQGSQKTAEELADFFDDMLNKQPAVIAIIDPMRRVEREAWGRLCQRVSERCLVIGDVAHRRPGLLLAETSDEEPLTSGWVWRLQQRTTVTELFDCAKRMRESGRVPIAGVGPSDTSDVSIVDVAVAMDARYIKLGAPVRSEKIDKFVRLANIGDRLQQAGQLGQWPELQPVPLKPEESDTPLADSKDSTAAARSRKTSAATRH